MCKTSPDSEGEETVSFMEWDCSSSPGKVSLSSSKQKKNLKSRMFKCNKNRFKNVIEWDACQVPDDRIKGFDIPVEILKRRDERRRMRKYYPSFLFFCSEFECCYMVSPKQFDWVGYSGNLVYEVGCEDSDLLKRIEVIREYLAMKISTGDPIVLVLGLTTVEAEKSNFGNWGIGSLTRLAGCIMEVIRAILEGFKREDLVQNVLIQITSPLPLGSLSGLKRSEDFERNFFVEIASSPIAKKHWSLLRFFHCTSAAMFSILNAPSEICHLNPHPERGGFIIGYSDQVRSMLNYSWQASIMDLLIDGVTLPLWSRKSLFRGNGEGEPEFCIPQKVFSELFPGSEIRNKPRSIEEAMGNSFSVNSINASPASVTTTTGLPTDDNIAAPSSFDFPTERQNAINFLRSNTPKDKKIKRNRQRQARKRRDYEARAQKGNSRGFASSEDYQRDGDVSVLPNAPHTPRVHSHGGSWSQHGSSHSADGYSHSYSYGSNQRGDSTAHISAGYDRYWKGENSGYQGQSNDDPGSSGEWKVGEGSRINRDFGPGYYTQGGSY